MLATWPLILLLSLADGSNPEPLLVVVECGSGETLEASALRSAVARELGLPVLSPAEEEPAEGVAILTVALAPDRAVVVLRRDNTTISRAIPLPRNGGQRLRQVTWLIGNVARDQTSDLLRHRREPADPEATAEATPPEQVAVSPLAPPPAPVTPSLPRVPVARSSPEPAVAATALSLARPEPYQWTVAVLTGRGFFDSDSRYLSSGFGWDAGGWNQLEVTHRGPSLGLGATLMTGRGYAAGLTLDWHRSLFSWLAPELGATFGLWGLNSPSYESDNQKDWKSDLFARFTAGVALSPAPWLDVLARAGFFAEMSRDRVTGDLSLGLRCRLP